MFELQAYLDPKKAKDIRKDFKAAAEKALKAVLFDIGKDFESTCATWNTKPTFLVEENYSGNDWYVRCFTTDTIYNYVNDGTNTQPLAIMYRWTAKTQPRVIGSNAGSGSIRAILPIMKSTGVTPREFDEVIFQKYKKDFGEIIQKAIYAKT